MGSGRLLGSASKLFDLTTQGCIHRAVPPLITVKTSAEVSNLTQTVPTTLQLQYLDHKRVFKK